MEQRDNGRLGLGSAIALNFADMVGVGPFLTLPLIVSAMGGPPVVLAWIAGAIAAMCDALVWAELAAAFPRAGGTYAYLREIYPGRAGRLLSFLFAAQVLLSAPLSMASGCIGMGHYLAFLAPGMQRALVNSSARFWFFGRVTVPLEISGASLAAAAMAALAVVLVYRRIDRVGRLARILAAGSLLALIAMIVAGFTHFHPALLADAAPGAWRPGRLLLLMPAGLLLAFYDYWGYYNVSFLGEEVERPARTIPRSMLLSVAIVAALYLLMNVSVLGSVPWRQVASTQAVDRLDFAAQFVSGVWGTAAGRVMAVLIMWTAGASVVALLTGYSRIVFAAARDGVLPRALARLNPGGFPGRAVLLLGVVTALFCFLRLSELITALVVLRIVLQFGMQAVGLLWLRARRPEAPRPFRMWLYPLPVLISLACFALVLSDKAPLLVRGCVLTVLAAAVFFLREHFSRKSA